MQVRTASCAGTACVNSFGDEQLAVDMLADKLLFEALRYSGVCKYACSEEVPEPVDMGGSGYCVAFDPLDGSSIIDTNFTVGTIFGVWPGDKLTGITGRDQAAAGMGVFGPRTIFCIALKDAPGTLEFLLQVRRHAYEFLLASWCFHAQDFVALFEGADDMCWCAQDCLQQARWRSSS